MKVISKQRPFGQEKTDSGYSPPSSYAGTLIQEKVILMSEAENESKKETPVWHTAQTKLDSGGSFPPAECGIKGESDFKKKRPFGQEKTDSGYSPPSSYTGTLIQEKLK
jgi:hypothetical protein